MHLDHNLFIGDLRGNRALSDDSWHARLVLPQIAVQVCHGGGGCDFDVVIGLTFYKVLGELERTFYISRSVSRYDLVPYLSQDAVTPWHDRYHSG